MFESVRRPRLGISLFCGLLAVTGASKLLYALDAGTTNLDTQTQAAIEAAVTNNLKSYGGNQPVPGAAVGVWAPGNRSFVKGFGSGQLSPQVPMSVNDKFRIGSNTKTFVVTVLLQLVQENRLGLDDTVDKFKLDVRMPDANRITIRQLAEMRSGIVDLYASPAFQALDITPQTNFDRHHWVQLALDQPRLFAPGTSYNYSNTNYMLLGMIIEAVTKDTVEHQIESRLIVPLGLRNTSFPTSNPAMPSPYAHGYMLDAKKDWKDDSVASAAVGVMGGGRDDLGHGRHEDMGQSLRHGDREQRSDTAAASGVHSRSASPISPSVSASAARPAGSATPAASRDTTPARYYLPAQDATIIVLVNSQQERKDKPDVASATVRDIARVLFPGNVPY